MKCTPQNAMTSLSVAAPLAGEAERVADVVRDVLDLGQLVVVGEDDRAALGGERADLGLQGGDVVGGDGRVDARTGAIGSRVVTGAAPGGGRGPGRGPNASAPLRRWSLALPRGGPDRRQVHPAAALGLRAARRCRAPRRADPAGSMLSSRIRAAPASSASSRPLRGVRHSTWSGRSGMRARPARTAATTPPGHRGVVLLDEAARRYRPTRWLPTPPGAHRASPAAAAPGVVLRVSRIRVPVSRDAPRRSGGLERGRPRSAPSRCQRRRSR
jgi:hypothetical protein